MRSNLTYTSFLLLTAVTARAEYNAPDLNRRPVSGKPLYGITAMVGKTSPTVATSIRRAVETAQVSIVTKPGSLTTTPAQKIVEETSGRDRVVQGNPDVVNGSFTTFKPVGARAFVDNHSVAAEAKQRELALLSLQSEKVLEDRLAQVRKAIAESQTEAEQLIASQPIVLEPTPEPVRAAPVDPGSPAGRLLAGVGTPNRPALASGYNSIRDGALRKDPRYAKLSNASGGVNFQASLEFNRSIRGSTASARSRDGNRYGFRERWSGESTAPADADDRAGTTLGFVPTTTEKRKPLFAIDGPGASPLVAHRPRYSDSSIEGAKGNPAGAAAVAGGARNGIVSERHRPKYGDKAIVAYEGGGAAAPGGQ